MKTYKEIAEGIINRLNGLSSFRSNHQHKDSTPIGKFELKYYIKELDEDAKVESGIEDDIVNVYIEVLYKHEDLKQDYIFLLVSKYIKRETIVDGLYDDIYRIFIEEFVIQCAFAIQNTNLRFLDGRPYTVIPIRELFDKPKETITLINERL